MTSSCAAGEAWFGIIRSGGYYTVGIIKLRTVGLGDFFQDQGMSDKEQS